VMHYKHDAVTVDPDTIQFGTDNTFGSEWGDDGGAVFQ